jgi:DNA-binding NarL/FixJ family response regulator
MTDKIKIYLADDHQMLIEGMKAVLNTYLDFEIVGFSLNGVNLIEKVLATNADVLIMDISMPEKDGLAVLRELSQFPNITFKIIVLSSYDDLKLVREVMQLGARGYLTKQCVGENIIESILEVQNDEEYFCKIIRDKIFEAFTKSHTEINLDENISLTEREQVILKLIALEYSGKEISEKLFISVNTVETHRKNLLKKLNVKSSIGLAKYAIKNNFLNL